MKTPLDIARAAWGDPPPDWVERLAIECGTSTQRRVADQLGRSAGLVSQVLRNKYPGDMAAIEDAVRGVWMGASVACPALGTISTAECQMWRARSRRLVNTNSLRVRMFRACNACPRNQKDCDND